MKLVEHANGDWVDAWLSERFHAGYCELIVLLLGEANNAH